MGKWIRFCTRIVTGGRKHDSSERKLPWVKEKSGEWSLTTHQDLQAERQWVMLRCKIVSGHQAFQGYTSLHVCAHAHTHIPFQVLFFNMCSWERGSCDLQERTVLLWSSFVKERPSERTGCQVEEEKQQYSVKLRWQQKSLFICIDGTYNQIQVY